VDFVALIAAKERQGMIGMVSKYDRVVGYGFLIPEDPTNPDAPDFFVHCSNIQGPKHQRFLRLGQIVEFDPIDVESRPQAVNVRKIPTTIARQVGGLYDA
jgi:cold shock CspA family protein